MRGIVRPDAGFGGEVEEPNNVGIKRTEGEQARRLLYYPGRRGRLCYSVAAARGERGGLFWSHVPSFLQIRAIVAIGETMGIQAQDFAAIAHQINTIPFDRNRGGNTTVWPVQIRIVLALWHDKLPEQLAAIFSKAHQDPAIALMF